MKQSDDPTEGGEDVDAERYQDIAVWEASLEQILNCLRLSQYPLTISQAKVIGAYNNHYAFGNNLTSEPAFVVEVTDNTNTLLMGPMADATITADDMFSVSDSQRITSKSAQHALTLEGSGSSFDLSRAAAEVVQNLRPDR